jgi:uncharacterized protein involved in response to NO
VSAIARTRGDTTGATSLRVASERDASRLMLAFAITGLLFMLVPGTLVGVWNLLSISADHTPAAIAPEWVQAHGHAQIFGWLGTLIIGIGYYSLPKARKRTVLGVDEGWVSLALWASGALLRWSVGLAPAGWRLTLPLAAVLELAGFAIFFRASAGHRPEGSSRLGAWAVVVIGGTAGFLIALVAHAWLALRQAVSGDSPAFPSGSNADFLALTVWGFLVPFVWGFSARWVCPLLGIERVRERHLAAAYGLSVAGVGLAVAGYRLAGALTLLAASSWIVFALRLFEPSSGRTRGRAAQPGFGIFARVAYVWLLAGSALGVWAEVAGDAPGVVGASRHALTVGFLVTMVLTIGPRILPAFAGAGELFSPVLATIALATVTAGCATRVVSQILAYQGYATGAWEWLPVSAATELAAISTFFANMAATFLRSRTDTRHARFR